MTAWQHGRPCDDWWERINEYIDGALHGAERVACEEHLGTCRACEAAAADLAQMRRAAQALPPRRPRADAWLRIADELARELPVQQSPAPSAWSATRVMLAAAAVLALAVTTTVYLVRPSAPTAASDPAPAAGPAGTTATETVNPPGQELVKSIDEELRAAESHYEKAIAGLEQIATSEDAHLDPALAATLQKNMGVIDQAIRDSRAALATQPANALAQDSLFEALQRKVSLLEDTIALINVMRKGDQAATARIVEGTSKS